MIMVAGFRFEPDNRLSVIASIFRQMGYRLHWDTKNQRIEARANG